MKRLVVGGAVLALGVAGMSVAAAEKPSGFKVTGGGQIIEEGVQGPGDTVGFNAQEIEGDDPASQQDTDDAAKGQFQYIQRGEDEAGNTPANESFHGVVTCLISGGEAVDNENDSANDDEPNQVEEGLSEGGARFGGYLRDDPETFFTVDVTDGGEGNGSDGDFILVRMTEEPCADNPEDEQNDSPDELVRLGRGNVQIHNNPDGAMTPTGFASTARYMVLAAV